MPIKLYSIRPSASFSSAGLEKRKKKKKGPLSNRISMIKDCIHEEEEEEEEE